jgi:hypothetical protein
MGTSSLSCVPLKEAAPLKEASPSFAGRRAAAYCHAVALLSMSGARCKAGITSSDESNMMLLAFVTGDARHTPPPCACLLGRWPRRWLFACDLQKLHAVGTVERKTAGELTPRRDADRLSPSLNPIGLTRCHPIG